MWSLYSGTPLQQHSGFWLPGPSDFRGSRARLTYAQCFLPERIADQKYAVKVLVTLYRYSTNTSGRTDVLTEESETKGSFVNPKRVFKKITKGVRMAATTTTTALGNVASEIAGRYVICFREYGLVFV